MPLIPSAVSRDQEALYEEEDGLRFDERGMPMAAAPANDDEEYEGMDEIQRLEVIDSIGKVLLEKRREAMEWRQQIGIEKDWEEDEQFYDSVDRANPEGETNVGKPMSPDGGVAEDYIVPNAQDQIVRSAVFVPLVRPYVDAASARVADMLLPNDDRPWELRATPEQDVIDVVATEVGTEVTPVAQVSRDIGMMMDGGSGPHWPQDRPGFAPGAQQALPNPMQGQADAMGAQPPAVMQQQQLPRGVASSALSEEEKAAEEANKIIEDWLIECQWHAEVRKVIEDAALVGTGILKGPFDMLVKMKKLVRNPASGVYELQTYEKRKPVSRRVNYRNFWPAPDGGEDHQSGSYCWEGDNISARKLRALLDDPTYIRKNLLKALREGPGKKTDAEQQRLIWELDIGVTFPLYYFTGDLTKELMVQAGVPEHLLPEGESEAVAVPVTIVMVNDLVVKIEMAPVDFGGFPYDMFPWQRRKGIPWGKGIARQVRTPQRMLNGGARAMMDNAGLCSGPIVGFREDWVEPADGDPTLRPRKVYHMTNKAPPTAKIDDALTFTNVQSNIAEIERVIDRALRFAEDATGLPMLMQGQQGEATTTATGMTILNNNGSTVLRRIARTFDDCVTEPHIRRYYYYLLADPDVRDSAKRDFQIDARGSTYLVDRDLQAQNLNQLFPMFAQHPDVHPGRLAEEVAQANRLQFKRIMLTEAEKAQRDAQPKPKDPRIEAVEIREAGANERHAKDAALKEGQLQATFELGLAKLANEGNISQDNIKALLATTLMRMQGDAANAADDRAANQGENREQRAHDRTSAAEQREHDRETAAVETPGRAPAGEGVSR